MGSVVSNTMIYLHILITIFLPPLSVFCWRGCGAEVLINICLCILGWFPGIIHAWYIIKKGPKYVHQTARVRRDQV